MKSVAKAEALFRDLKEKLEFRLSGSSTIDTVAESKDSNGWPILTLSDGGAVAAGNPVIVLRAKSINAVSKDVFGNNLIAFTPHELEIAYELDGTEGEPSRIDLSIVMLEASKLGMKIAIKEIADGTAVDETSIDAASATKEIEFDVKWPKKGM